jgi:hypothetical protein
VTSLVKTLLAFALCASTLDALEIARGRMKLTLYEGIGRFSISYLADESTGLYKPLLFAKDPRTSVTSLSVGDRVYRRGESGDFHQEMERTPGGALFKWTSQSLEVTQEFSLLADAIRIELTIRNTAQKDLEVGVRTLFDTLLGEPSGVHFMTDKIPEIDRETTLTAGQKPAYWVSPLVGDPGKLGLMTMLSGSGITPPDRVVFANWKRLYDAAWEYETSPSRDFNLMPYSVNDSAVCEYFDPRKIAAGSEWRIETVMGKYAPSGIGTGSAIAAEDLAPPPQAVIPPIRVSDPSKSAGDDLRTVDEILAEIDAGVFSVGSVTERQLNFLAMRLSELKNRSAARAKGAGK